MGKFFANQKKDEAGLVGITLQKLLIFFMVLDGIMMIFGFSFFASMLSLLFHFAVFMGVYRRRTAVLLIYVVLNVLSFVLAAFLLLLLASSSMYGDYSDSDSYDSSSSHIHEHHGKNSTVYADNVYAVHNFLRSWYMPVFGNVTGSSSSSSSSVDSSSSSSDSSSNSYSSSSSSDSIWGSGSFSSYGSDSYEVYSGDMFLISLVVLVVAIGLLYCKILSVVLAHRMRKILLTSSALPVSQQQTANVNADDNDNTPFLVPEDMNHPYFAQPGFVPYPPMQGYPYPGQNGHAMMPPPFMYGQHPVFYTFAPMQQQPPSDDENSKL